MRCKPWNKYCNGGVKSVSFSHCENNKQSSLKCQSKNFPAKHPSTAGQRLRHWQIERCTVKVTVYFPGQNSKTLPTWVYFQPGTEVKEGNVVIQNAPWQLSPAVGRNGHKIVTWLKVDHINYLKNMFYNEFRGNQLLNNSARWNFGSLRT